MTPFVGYVIAMGIIFVVARALLRIPQRDVPLGTNTGE
jgi:hypothetical protein